MDDDLKRYLDQNFQHFGQQIQQLREETVQQFQEARAETDRQFREARAETDRQFREMREETAEQFAKVDQRLDGLQSEVRGAYVFIENLDGKVRLVAEGVANVAEQLERLDDKVSRELEEIKVFNRLSYTDLDIRVRKLEAAK